MSTEHETVEPGPAEKMSPTEKKAYQERIIVRDRVQNRIEDVLGFITPNNPRATSLTVEEVNVDYFLWTMDLGGKNMSNALRFDSMYQQIVSQGKVTDEGEIINIIAVELIPKDNITFKVIDGVPVFLGLKSK